MKTLIPVMYRDGSNYKRASAIEADGDIAPSQVDRLRDALDDGLYYAPQQLGLTHHGYGAWPRFPDPDLDHGWHEMLLGAIVVSDSEPGFLGIDSPRDTVGSVESFVCRVEAAATVGWSPIDPSAIDRP